LYSCTYKNTSDLFTNVQNTSTKASKNSNSFKMFYDISATVFYYALETQETKETTIIRA